ncbi:SufD family Fe-S cluster assembly protein [Porphyrobacter algicida]|uniref:SufD family Fe-S cluster assembly protein n=1 Tax=Qipengyuania algicida TaxID=1836209 RepID=A0A845AC94_9SPHN|nr:SufD family Fe-S cluster assembly protein [Qipengyuania algicida]MXP28072.1 SufD family Fe-S cluster assembly protein [Qipengyuania algicida]
MSQAALLPTRRDEAWRYSDTDALGTLAPGRLDAWRNIDVGAGEQLVETLVLDGSDPVALDRLRVTIGEGGHFALFALVIGGDLGRLEVEVSLAEGAHFELGGVTLGGGETTREIVTKVDHGQPGATSNQVVRSVHWGKSAGNFLGQIEVARHAQKTDAGQSFKGLLLERGASVNSVPQLEIFADDVKCAHGAAIGQLDEQAGFYMAARGLPPETARRLMVQAFIGDAFVAMVDDEAREAMTERALEQLEARL